MKVGDRFKDEEKIVVIADIKGRFCRYKPVERWDGGPLETFWGCPIDKFEEYVRYGFYTPIPSKSANFTSLYEKLNESR